MNTRFILSLLGLYTFANSCVFSYNILGLFPSPSKSHFILFDSLMTALAERGHNVTVYNAFPKQHFATSRRDVSVSECFKSVRQNVFDIEESFGRNLFSATKMSTMSLLLRYENQILACEPLRQLRNLSGQFDALITETFVHDFFAVFAYTLNAPLMLIHSRPAYPWMSSRAALPDNPSFVPHPFSDLTPNMNFAERLQNTLMYLHALYFYKFYSENKYDSLVPAFFGQRAPRIDQVVRNASILFLNSHRSLNGARPMVPSVIEIGGLNVKPSADELPKVRLNSAFYKSMPASFLNHATEKISETRANQNACLLRRANNQSFNIARVSENAAYCVHGVCKILIARVLIGGKKILTH